MYSSTRGIVFRQTRYSDTSLVVRILTEEFGLRSFLIKGARGPKSKMKASLFQPLSLLEITIPVREKGELHHLREARVIYPYRTIPDNIFKTSILLFLNELLYKSIREESANRELFAFIFEDLVWLDEAEKNLAHFHLLFMAHLTRHLGFSPQGKHRGDSTVFNLQEGTFSTVMPLFQSQLVRGPVCKYLSELLSTPMHDLGQLSAPATIRQEMLEVLITYYTLHLPISGEFKSHKVLHELFRNPLG